LGELSAILGSKIEAISFNFAPMRFCKRTKRVAGSTGRLNLSSETEDHHSFHSFSVASANIATQGFAAFQRVLRFSLAAKTK
jgi:hypothetical protein